MSNQAERFIWAAKLMDVQPDNTILEIGCGAGLLAEQISDCINMGTVLAIDKSSAMIEKAKKRNQKHLASKVLHFEVCDFLKCQLPVSGYDKVAAFNVNFFGKNPVKELTLIKNALKKDGILYVFYQAPFEITITAADPIKTNLIENGFKIIDITLKKLIPTSAVGIIAKPVEPLML